MANTGKIDKIIKDINDEFSPDGAQRPVIARGKDIPAINYIPASSYAIGYMIGTGGWPEGKLIEFFGPEHAGKTTLMYVGLMDCYNFYNGERPVALIDIEHRFNEEWAAKFGLFKDDNLIVAQPPNAERGTDIMTRLIKSGDICAIGFDSIGAATTSEEQEEFADRGAIRGGAARVMSRNVGSVAPYASLYNCTCFYINQVRDDMEGYHRIITPGGHKPKHMMSLRVYIRRGRDKYMDKKTGEQVGFPMVFKTYKNSFGPAPREQYSDFYFQPSHWYEDIGFDTEKELTRLGLQIGLVERKSSWYYYGDVKGNGRDNFFETLREEGLYDQLAKEVQQHLTKELEAVEFEDEDLNKPEADGPELDE